MLTTLLPFIIAGLVSGSVYGLAGSGLVLSYKTSGVFNFAYGALASVAAYVFFTLNVQHALNWWISGFIAVIVLGVVLGLGFEVLARRIVRVPAALSIAATVGIVVLVEAATTLIYGATPVTVPQFLPQQSFTVDDVVIQYAQVIVVAIGVIITVAMYLYLRTARLGMAMRAVVDDPDLLSLSEFNPERVRRTAWIVGCVLATLAGVLIAPTISLSPTELPLLVIDAFGAAAIGRFSNLPVTYIGGLALGVASSLATKYVGNNQFLLGLPDAIPFIVLFVVLVVVPKGRLFLRSERHQQLSLSMPKLSKSTQTIVASPAFVIMLLVPVLFKSHILIWGEGLIFVILFASMVLLVRVAGQVSLCQGIFMAIGASTFAHLAGTDHWPWFLALLVASCVTIPIAALLAFPASRLPVLFLGLATLGFGLLVQEMFYGTSLMFTQFSQGLHVGRPVAGFLNLSGDKAYYYVIAVFATLSVLIIIALTRSRLGRVLTGLSDSPLALSTLGADERVTRVIVFCISAFFAALAGGLYAGLLGNVSEQTFDPLASLTFFVLIVIVVGDVVWASIAAAAGTAIIPGYISSSTTTQYLQLAFGVIAILTASGLLPQPKFPRLRRKQAEEATELAAVESAEAAQVTITPVPRPRASLAIENVSMVFGGLTAVDDVSLKVRESSITGLIGPNGAGKTTTFNVCSGLLSPTSGRVMLDGRNVTRISPSRRARMGLGRTFQQTQLFSSMTVEENIALGSEASIAGASPISQVFTRKSQKAGAHDAVEAVIEICNLQDLRAAPALTLSTGQRRTVELARTVAGSARVLLLDEPSAGLDEEETEAFGHIMQRITTEFGIAILLVEHDMDLVMGVCENIYVLDFGRLIFEGTPREVQSSEIVQIAYLGEPGSAELDELLPEPEEVHP